LGIKEQIIFPEVDIDKNPRIHGLEITFVTSAKSDQECRALLAAFGVPFKKRNN
ncbi:MAG: 50S ribosomal protein L5, partial [Candidatus Cryptobacteroides sp.]